jgi:high-affinity iron transporter
MGFSAALPTFVITLREGVEAALVVGIVLACLRKAEATGLNRWVWLGVGSGLIASLLVGLGLGQLIAGTATSASRYAPVVRQLLEALFCLIAVGLLSWMLVWMTQQSRTLKIQLEAEVRSALNRQTGRGIFLLIFVAVLREGFETVVFILAQLQQGGWAASLGAIAGLLGATLIGLLLFQGGVRLNLKRFFQIMGILLLLIVAGLVVSFLRKLDTGLLLFAQISESSLNFCVGSGPACLLGPQVWDLSSRLPDQQFPGLVLKALFGYSQKLYLVQAIAYLSFLLAVGFRYFRSLQTPPPQTTSTIEAAR